MRRMPLLAGLDFGLIALAPGTGSAQQPVTETDGSATDSTGDDPSSESPPPSPSERRLGSNPYLREVPDAPSRGPFWAALGLGAGAESFQFSGAPRSAAAWGPTISAGLGRYVSGSTEDPDSRNEEFGFGYSVGAGIEHRIGRGQTLALTVDLLRVRLPWSAVGERVINLGVSIVFEGLARDRDVADAADVASQIIDDVWNDR